MKELVRIIATSLVDHPEQVEVTETETAEQITVELKVAQEDMGKVIGKQGRIAKSIRTVVRAAAAAKDDRKVVVDIV
ncbi:MAG: KH domain-containing protein [Lachnospiraceae bacterium]|nr:KH domain-containing protein [Lachnospiraceae bacterium]